MSFSMPIKRSTKKKKIVLILLINSENCWLELRVGFYTRLLFHFNEYMLWLN